MIAIAELGWLGKGNRVLVEGVTQGARVRGKGVQFAANCG